MLRGRHGKKMWERWGGKRTSEKKKGKGKGDDR